MTHCTCNQHQHAFSFSRVQLKGLQVLYASIALLPSVRVAAVILEKKTGSSSSIIAPNQLVRLQRDLINRERTLAVDTEHDI